MVGSSFAAEAAAVHGRPVVDVSVDASPGVAGAGGTAVVTVLGQDASLPRCGLHEYLRADAPRPRPPPPHPPLPPPPQVPLQVPETCAGGVCAEPSSQHPAEPSSQPPAESTEPSVPGFDEPSSQHPAEPSSPLVCYDEAGERRMCTVAFRACLCEAPYRRLTGLPALLCPAGPGEGQGQGEGSDACVPVLADSNGYSLSP